MKNDTHIIDYSDEQQLKVTDSRPLETIQDEATMLISQAIQKNTPVETIEKLLSMRRELRAEKAKEAYDQAMSRFQAECPTIEKRKQGYNYKYAPLESIVEQVKELLSKNGFSYTFDTDEVENAMVVYCKVKHIAGHMEVSKAQIAREATTKMNASQQSGAAMTYGKRYAFCNAFGILTGDEDTDARSVTPEKSFYAQAREKYNEAQQTEPTAETEAVDHYKDMSIGALKVELAGLMSRGIIAKDFPSMSRLSREEIIETLEAHTTN